MSRGFQGDEPDLWECSHTNLANNGTYCLNCRRSLREFSYGLCRLSCSHPGAHDTCTDKTLEYDFNDGYTEWGTREVVIPQDMENVLRTGDTITLEDMYDKGMRVRAKITCIVAIVRDLEPVRT